MFKDRKRSLRLVLLIEKKVFNSGKSESGIWGGMVEKDFVQLRRGEERHFEWDY